MSRPLRCSHRPSGRSTPKTATSETTSHKGQDMRLLLQPHGFEGFAHLAVLPELDDRTVAESGDVDFALVKLHVARPAASSNANRTTT